MPKHEVGGTNAVIGEMTSGKAETIKPKTFFLNETHETHVKKGPAAAAEKKAVAFPFTPVGPKEEVGVEKIWLDGGNHRIKELESEEQTARLMETLRRDGQQQPIRVTSMPKEGRPYRLIFGERRLSALVALGMKTVEACVSAPMGELEIETVRAVENLDRRDPELAEVCKLVGRMFEAVRRDALTRGENLSEEQACQAIGGRIHRPVSWVRDHLRIKRCESSKKAWEYLTLGKKQKDGSFIKLPKQHAREIAKLSDPLVRDEMAEWCLTSQGVWDEMPKRIGDLRDKCSELMHDLSKVPWSLTVAFAGGPACESCPSNSKNDVKLFEHDGIGLQQDVKRGMCLNHACFERKRGHTEKELKESVARAASSLKQLAPADKKSGLKDQVLRAGAPTTVRPETFAEQVREKVGAAKKDGSSGPSGSAGKKARLNTKDLAPSTKQIAERKLEEALIDWNGRMVKAVRDAVFDKPGRLAATAMLLENPAFKDCESYRPAPKALEKLRSPASRKMLALTAAPTMAGILVLEKSAEDCDNGALFHLYETVGNEVYEAMADAWGLKLDIRPVLEDFMPKVTLVKKGTCRDCGCTEKKACVTKGVPCHWIDASETRCSACRDKAGAKGGAKKAAKKKKGGKK